MEYIPILEMSASYPGVSKEAKHGRMAIPDSDLICDMHGKTMFEFGSLKVFKKSCWTCDPVIESSPGHH
jgi:hypothetical protein